MNASFIEVCYISEKFGAQIWFKNYFVCFASEKKHSTRRKIYILKLLV